MLIGGIQRLSQNFTVRQDERKSEQYILAVWKDYRKHFAPLLSSRNPLWAARRAEFSVMLIGFDWKWEVLRKLLRLHEMNPVKIHKKLTRIYSI